MTSAGPDTAVHVSRHQPVLGTVLELRVATDRGPHGGTAADAVAARAEHEVLATFDRLEALFSVHRADSALVRWRAGELDDPGAEVCTVLALAARWWERSGGVVHPATGAVTARWRRAAAEGRVPTSHELDRLAASLRELPYRVEGEQVLRVGDCTGVDLNAIAKGWIADRALEAALAVPGVRGVVVNAGGDLVHGGEGSVPVRLEDPRSPARRTPPIERVEVSHAALATSGSAHRGVRVGATWFGHVLDPRTARPVDQLRSASVIASDAATADAVATVVGVLDVDEAIGFVDALDGVACCLVTADDRVVAHPRWASWLQRPERS